MAIQKSEIEKCFHFEEDKINFSYSHGGKDRKLQLLSNIDVTIEATVCFIYFRSSKKYIFSFHVLPITWE